MWKYILKRGILLFITFYLIVTLIYILCTFSNYEIWYRGFSRLELLSFAWKDYLQYAKGVWTEFDLGMYSFEVTVVDHVLKKLETTLKLNLYAFLFYTPLGIILGMLTAYYHKSWFDKIISTVTVLLSSVPGYVSMLFLMMYLGYRLGWFPGRFDHSPDGAVSFIQSITLPVIALSLGPIAKFTRTLRGELVEAMQEDYIFLVRTKGFKRWHMLTRHALKNSLLPLISEIPLTFSLVISMSFIIEMTYNIYGAAQLMWASIIVPSIDGNYLQIDVPTTVVISGFYVGFVMIVTFISDFSYALVDPRIAMGSKK